MIFYAWGEPVYIFLMLIVVFVNFEIGKKLGKTRNLHKKKRFLYLAISIDLLVLIFFKYTNLLVELINLSRFFSLPQTNIKLPLGISFYIFQTMTYIIDIYRRECKYQKSFSSLLLYVALFPQLIAGPIVKYVDIKQDLYKYDYESDVTKTDSNVDLKISNVDEIFNGVYRFAIGLGKKVLLANNLGRVAEILLKQESITRLSIWIGLIYFLLQLFFDFAGYSDMAIGLGEIFGFHYKENFNYPYVSKSITEFWRRWHISLGTFFREYVYIPLGGKYKHQIRNILIAFTRRNSSIGYTQGFNLIVGRLLQIVKNEVS